MISPWQYLVFDTDANFVAFIQRQSQMTDDELKGLLEPMTLVGPGGHEYEPGNIIEIGQESACWVSLEDIEWGEGFRFILDSVVTRGEPVRSSDLEPHQPAA